MIINVISRVIHLFETVTDILLIGILLRILLDIICSLLQQEIINKNVAIPGYKLVIFDDLLILTLKEHWLSYIHSFFRQL